MLLCGLLLLACLPSAVASQGRRAVVSTCVVRRVIDGDTFECMLRRKPVRIRLLGIDAPELRQKPFGGQAKDFLAQLLPARDSIMLDMDVRETDRYGRTLAYAWNDSAVMINEELLRAGLALVDIQQPNVKYAEELRAAADTARRRKAGLWATNAFDCVPSDFRQKKCP